MKVAYTYRMLLAAIAGVLLVGSAARAADYELAGRQLSLFGYISQSAQFSLYDDYHYDTEEGLNSVLFNFFLEGQYRLTPQLALYSSGQVTVDWIYDLKHDNESWEDKLFNESREDLYVDDEYWQLLRELHLTWTPNNFFFRVGKQIVAWGEMLGIRLMDQINPWDQRRGFVDVEFDSTIIPIWLARAEYYFPTDCLPSWTQDLGLELVFNPNADFIPDQLIQAGNDEGGIWAPDITFPNPLPFIPVSTARVGSGLLDLEKPDDWDAEGHEYGVRLKGLIEEAYVTLNYFYGYDNSPVTVNTPPPPPGAGPPPQFAIADDRTVILPANLTGYYGRLRFVGFTVARELEALRLKAIGGVAPMLRVEAFYAFDVAFGTQNPANPAFQESFDKHDDVRYAVSMDWKVWIKALNPRHSFAVIPTFYHRHIRDYPDTYLLKESTGQGVEDDNYVLSLMMNTSYFHEKIVPSVFWLRDLTNRATMWRLQLTYDRNTYWHYTLGAFLLNGKEMNKGFDVFENKDYIYFKVSYKWG